MEKLHRWNEVVNPEMGLNMTMNKYVNTKTGKEAIMHNNKSVVENEAGTWKLASSITKVAGVDAPESEVKIVAPVEPVKVVGAGKTQVMP